MKKILILNGKTNLFNENKFSYLPEKFLRLVWKTNLLKQKKIIHFFKERTNLMICKCFPTFLKKNFPILNQPLFFLFSERFSYHLHPYSCCSFYLFSSERFRYLSQALFVAFLCFLVIFNWWIFRHFCIWEKKTTFKKFYKLVESSALKKLTSMK